MEKFLLAVAVVTLSPFATWGADHPEVTAHVKTQDVPIAKLGEKFRLIGKLGEPLGAVVTVQGFMIEGPFKGSEGGPNLRVQRINGRATQEDIQICLSPYFGDFGEQRRRGEGLPKLENGKVYEFEGFETGSFVGVPHEAYKRASIWLQTPGFYFRHCLVVYKVKTIQRIIFSPSDFVDRDALLEGKAVNRDKKAYIQGNGWKRLTGPTAAWPEDLQGKTVEGFGTVKKTETGDYRLHKGATRLVRLEDQRGRSVELRGIAWSSNDYWWFEYRGIRLYVEGMKQLPDWSLRLHGRPVLITGTLEEDSLPNIDQISIKSDPDKNRYFIVRNAGWKPLDVLLAPERVERQ